MSTGRKVIGTSVRGVALAALCFALFDVPAAYVASRGYSPWLALAAGLASFPVLALVWHVLGERARRRSPPASPKTKNWERLLLRGIAVGVVVVGALVGVAGRTQVWRAARYHALWFLPGHTGSLAADSPLFEHVPSDADTLLWVRLSDEARAELGRALAPIADASRAVAASEYLIAAGASGFLIAETGDSKIIDLANELSSTLRGFIPDSAHDMFSTTQGVASDGVHYLVSKPWASTPTSPRAPLFELLPRVPADADIVAVVRSRGPSKYQLDGLSSFVGYARVARGTLELVGTLELATEADAHHGREEVEKGLADFARDDDAKKMLQCWRRYGSDGVATTGTRIELSAVIPVDDLGAFVACASKD